VADIGVGAGGSSSYSAVARSAPSQLASGGRKTKNPKGAGEEDAVETGVHDVADILDALRVHRAEAIWQQHGEAPRSAARGRVAYRRLLQSAEGVGPLAGRAHLLV